MNKRQKLIYLVISVILSIYILAVFINPTKSRVSINGYYPSTFLNMIHGTADKPFVGRALVPSVVSTIEYITPGFIKVGFADFAENNYNIKMLTDILEWERKYFYLYFCTLIILLLSYLGTAYIGPKFLQHVCNIGNTFFNKIVLLIITFLVLPPFFVFTSFIYDPPQLLLFVTCLYLISIKDHKKLFFVFLLLCINKETAILIIPIFIMSNYEDIKKKKHGKYILLLSIIYVVIRIIIAAAFARNYGSVSEFHLIDHNIKFLLKGWNFIELFALLFVSFLISYRWHDKPYFLRITFLCTFVPLVTMCVFFGVLEEWRGYYEAFFPFLGLSIDTYLKIRNALAAKSN